MATGEQDAWLLRVLGIRAGGTAELAARREQLAAAGRALDGLKAEGGPELPALLAAWDAAEAALAGPDGSARLQALDALIARAQSAARGREAGAANQRGIAYPKLLLRWRSAQAQAREAVGELGRALLAMPEVQADPRLARVQAAVAQLPGLIPDLGGQLEDLLDAGINAGSDGAIARDALAAVAEYRGRLAAAAQLKRIEGFAKAHVGDLAMVSALDGALAEIAANLKPAAPG